MQYALVLRGTRISPQTPEREVRAGIRSEETYRHWHRIQLLNCHRSIPANGHNQGRRDQFGMAHATSKGNKGWLAGQYNAWTQIQKLYTDTSLTEALVFLRARRISTLQSQPQKAYSQSTCAQQQFKDRCVIVSRSKLVEAAVRFARNYFKCRAMTTIAEDQQ